MDETNLQSILQDHGMKDQVASNISDEVSGTDLISLIDSLSEISDDDIESTIDVLDEYGIIVTKIDFEREKPTTESKGRKMVRKIKEESALSYDPVVARIRKLAGLSLYEDEETPSEEPADAPSAEPGGDAGDAGYDEPESYDEPAPVDADNAVDDFSDLNDVSEAMSTIQDAINNISTSFSNLRVSEYKQVVDQIKELSDSIRDQGRQYLGERMNRRRRW